MKKEQGFILPLTIIILFILCSALFHLISTYEREKRFQYEQEQFFMMQSIYQMTTVDLVSLVANGGETESGVFHYEKGSAYYWKSNENEHTVTIAFNVITKDNRQKFAEVSIHKENFNVTDWIELRN